MSMQHKMQENNSSLSKPKQNSTSSLEKSTSQHKNNTSPLENSTSAHQNDTSPRQNGTSPHGSTTLSLTQYPKNMVQTMITYLYTGIMQIPQNTQCELFSQLLNEFGLLPLYVTLAKPQENQMENNTGMKRTTFASTVPENTTFPETLDTVKENRTDLDRVNKVQMVTFTDRNNAILPKLSGNQNGNLMDVDNTDNVQTETYDTSNEIKEEDHDNVALARIRMLVNQRENGTGLGGINKVQTYESTDETLRE